MRHLLHLFVLCLVCTIRVSAYADEVPNDEIWYEASEKLSETTVADSSGLHTDAFNVIVKSHTFSNGKGIIKFDGDVTSIGDYAFYKCSSLTSIDIPNSVTKIGNGAFYNCKSLSSVTLGNGVKTIGGYAFRGCSSLPSISIPYNVQTIGNYVFAGCSSLSDVTFEDRVETLSLGSNGSSPLFVDCPLENVYIGGKISYNTSSGYGYSPFYRNTSLKNVAINDIEDTIYDNEFYGCTNLQSVTIGDGVKAIGSWAFSGCSSLSYFAFGQNVKKIGQEAFSDCTGITKIIATASVPPTCGSQALDDINKWDCELFVPGESVDDYMAANQWMEFFFVSEYEGEIPVLASELNINNDSMVLVVGNQGTLTATILPSNSSNKSVVWKSLNKDIAEVDMNSGVVTAKAAGSATIIAMTVDGSGLTATCTVVVREPNFKAQDNYDNVIRAIVCSGNDVTIDDTFTSLEVTENVDDVNISYSRTYKNTSWQAWNVPFGFTLTSDIASRFSFAKFAGTYTEAGQFFITLVEMRENEIVKANTPYFVCAKTADSNNPQVLNISNTTLYATDASGFQMLSAEKGIAVYGTYAKKVAAADDDWYAYGGGKYIKATAGQSLGAFRFYLTILDREDNMYASTPNPIEIKVIVLGDEADGISSLNESNKANDNGAMFNLAGQPVGADYKGVVIRNGKKVLIK